MRGLTAAFLAIFAALAAVPAGAQAPAAPSDRERANTLID